MKALIRAASYVAAGQHACAARYAALPPRRQRQLNLAVAIFCVAALSIFAAEPAFAQNLEGFANRILALLSGTLLRTLSIIAVILVGLGWMSGRVNTSTLVTVLIAVTIVFSAPFIVDAIRAG